MKRSLMTFAQDSSPRIYIFDNTDRYLDFLEAARLRIEAQGLRCFHAVICRTKGGEVLISHKPNQPPDDSFFRFARRVLNSKLSWVKHG